MLVLTSSKMPTLRLTSARQYSVGTTPCGLLSKRRTPRRCSRSATVLDTTGCDTASCRAALPMLPCCATATATRTCCNFSRSPMISGADLLVILESYHAVERSRYPLSRKSVTVSSPLDNDVDQRLE